MERILSRECRIACPLSRFQKKQNVELEMADNFISSTAWFTPRTPRTKLGFHQEFTRFRTLSTLSMLGFENERQWLKVMRARKPKLQRSTMHAHAHKHGN